MKETIQKEVVNDYFTAGIKAEVILDMLLRPVLEKTLGQLLKEEDQKVRFITKEFPIPTKPTKANDNHNHNCNVDYLMHDNDYVYLIELKTSSTSEDKKQLKNYIERIYKKENRGKSFGELFGERFIWMLNHVSVSGIGDGKISETKERDWLNELKAQLGTCESEWSYMEELFKKIVFYGSSEKEENISDHAKCAKEYLKKNKKTGSAKYLFQAGQILDNKQLKEWWGYEVYLVYIVPEKKVFRKKLEEVLKDINMAVDLDNKITVIEINDIKEQLDDNDEYDNLLKSILKDIF